MKRIYRIEKALYKIIISFIEIIKKYKCIFGIIIFFIFILLPIICARGYGKLFVILLFGNGENARTYLQYVGALLGGATTLIAVLITTLQAKKFQIENMNKTTEMQIENQKQMYISNINEKIRDLREKLKGLDECERIISENNLIHKKNIHMDDINFQVILEYSTNIQKYHRFLINQAGIVGIDDMREKDIIILKYGTQLAEIANYLMSYFLNNIEIKNIDDGNLVMDKIDDSINIYSNINILILELRNIILGEVNNQIDIKYRYMEQ